MTTRITDTRCTRAYLYAERRDHARSRGAGNAFVMRACVCVVEEYYCRVRAINSSREHLCDHTAIYSASAAIYFVVFSVS